MRNIYFTNRKEYYRRKKISASLKRYYAEKKPEGVRKFRRRRQVVFNSDYSISIRIIQINGTATLKEMERVLEDLLVSEPVLNHIPFYTKGLEDEEISDDEDKGLKDNLFYVELNIRGNVTLINL